MSVLEVIFQRNFDIKNVKNWIILQYIEQFLCCDAWAILWYNFYIAWLELLNFCIVSRFFASWPPRRFLHHMIWSTSEIPYIMVNRLFLVMNIGGTTLDCIIWSLVETHQSVTFGFGFNHIRLQHFYDFICEVLQSNVVQP